MTGSGLAGLPPVSLRWEAEDPHCYDWPTPCIWIAQDLTQESSSSCGTFDPNWCSWAGWEPFPVACGDSHEEARRLRCCVNDLDDPWEVKRSCESHEPSLLTLPTVVLEALSCWQYTALWIGFDGLRQLLVVWGWYEVDRPKRWIDFLSWSDDVCVCAVSYLKKNKDNSWWWFPYKEA